MHAGKRLSLPVLLASLLLGCAPSDPADLDPRTLPMKVEVVRTFSGSNIAEDLDVDGRDELIAYRFASNFAPEGGGSVLMSTQDGVIIGQENFQGVTGEAPVTADLDGNGTRELIVPIIRRDSLFGQIMDHRGRIGRRFFITAGQYRLQWPEQTSGEAAVPDTMPWDPRLYAAFVRDLDGDGRRELLTVVGTGYARQPRGVVIHRLPGLVKEAELSTGAGLDGQLAHQGGDVGRFLQDFDGDGAPELVWSAGSGDNGADVGGFSDDRSYVMLFDLNPPAVAWSEVTGPVFTYAQLGVADFTGDGRDEWLVGIRAARAGQASEIRVLDTRTKQVLVRRPAPESLRRIRVAELDGDPAPEVLVMGLSGTLYLYDHTLRLIRRRAWPSTANMVLVPDADGDQRDEVLVNARAWQVVLDGTLEPRARIPEGFNVSFPANQGVGRPGLLLGGHVSGARSALFRMVPQPFWWVHRYGQAAGWLLGLGALTGLAAYGVQGHRRARVAEALTLELQRRTHEAVLLADERGRPQTMSPRLRAWLGRNGSAGPLQAEAPELHGLLQELPAGAATQREAELRLPGRAEPVRAVAEPLMVAGRPRPFWLVRLSPDGADAEPTEAWRLMARRVAHDLKNPLTAILLTVQRMQREAERRDPATAEALTPHADRVADRVEHLRRLTRTFMKFVGVEAPELERGDLAAFTAALAEELAAEQPSDIALVWKAPGEPVPPVAFDREQMRSVIENLVTNAVAAMPEGGRVTLAVSVARGLLLGTDETPRDCAVLEVLDTGLGMPPEIRARIFEVGYTTRRDGTGLGLAVVRRIVEGHGGDVEVRSEEGVGTEFCLYLPAADQPFSK